MNFFEKGIDLVTRRKIEQLQAELAYQKGITDYIAMMADVDIPVEEGGDENVV